MAKSKDKGIVLQIELLGFKPKIWRKVIISEKSTFQDLHKVILFAMGWGGGHLSQFIVGRGDCFISPETPYAGFMDDEGDLKATKVKVTEFLAEKGARINYVYDFGDDWTHLVTVKDLKKDEKERDGNYPRCIDGAMACPPDDCGGVWGYADLLKAIKDKKHPEHEEMLEWLGGAFDPEAFDIEEVNKTLKRLR